MPTAYKWHSRGREPHVPNRDLIGIVVHSSALSYRRAFERISFRVAAVVGHWWLPLRRGAGVFDGMRLIVG